MIDEETELLLFKSANHPGGDASTAGGAKSATQILGLVAGEFLTRMRSKRAGTIDNSGDIEKQYQKAFYSNESATDDLLDASIQLVNGEKRPASPGVAKFTTTEDEDGRSGKVWGVLHSTGLIDTETVNFTATPGDHNGAKTFDFILRRWIINSSSGAEEDLAGDVTLKVGSETTGFIPAGHSWASEEFQVGMVATVDDTGTTTNRKTAPGGITFSRAYDDATALPIRNDSGDDTLEHGQAQGFWVQQILQPTMPSAPPTLELLFKLKGDST